MEKKDKENANSFFEAMSQESKDKLKNIWNDNKIPLIKKIFLSKALIEKERGEVMNKIKWN